jgi:hypothetical protein
MAQLGDAAPKIVYLNSRGGTASHGHLPGRLHERLPIACHAPAMLPGGRSA